MNRLPTGKKRKLTVLIGDHELGANEVMLSCLARINKDGDEIVVVSTGKPERLLEFARNQKFDLCILVLNNILFQVIPWKARRQYTLDLVVELKRACLAPIIAFAGVTEDILLPEDAERAGVNHFFWMPFSATDFMEAVKKCVLS
jgi:hypothetical protein